MAGSELVVTGEEEVAAALDELGRLAADLTEPNRRIVSGLIPEISSRTPRRTGALAVSWQPGADAGSGSISSHLEYAGPIEFGTRRGVRPYAMIRDTLSARSEDIVKGYEEAIADKGRELGFGVDR